MEGARAWVLAPVGRPGVSLRCDPALSPSAVGALAELLADDRRIEALPRLGTGRRALVGRLVVGSERLVVKRYTNPGLFLLRTLGQRGKAAREAEALQLIAERTGNPIRALAWAERRRLGMVAASWLVTNELPDAVDLRRIRRSEDPAERAWVKAAALERLPAALARLHRAGIAAGNLMAKNVLVQRESLQLALIDQPHARLATPLSERQRLYDLACLFRELRHGLSSAETRAFLRDYLRALEEGSPLERPALERDGLDRIEAALGTAVAARAHETPLRRLWHALRARWKRTRLGQLATGHRYDDDPDREHAGAP